MLNCLEDRTQTQPQPINLTLKPKPLTRSYHICSPVACCLTADVLAPSCRAATGQKTFGNIFAGLRGPDLRFPPIYVLTTKPGVPRQQYIWLSSADLCRSSFSIRGSRVRFPVAARCRHLHCQPRGERDLFDILLLALPRIPLGQLQLQLQLCPGRL